ncbi:MAG: PKD domain-containing protein [Gammaproteobacteria bacterium]
MKLQSWVGALSLLCAFARPGYAATAAYIDSPSGDYVGQGQELTYTSPSTSFTVTPGTHSLPGSMNVAFAGWLLNLQGPGGQKLVPGNYELVHRYPFNNGPDAGLDFFGQGRGCNEVEGWIEVHEAVYSGDTPVSFAADFLQECDGGPPLFGAVRINSDVPLQRPQPAARARMYLVAAEGEVVTLDGSRSFSHSSSIETWRWSRTAGPVVTLQSPNSPVASFTAPAVAPGGATLQFTLTVTDSAGRTDQVPVQVKVFDSGDPRTRFFYDSERYDYIGEGRFYQSNESDSATTPSFENVPGFSSDAVENLIEVAVLGIEDWNVILQPPRGQNWQPGTYGIVQRWPFRGPDRPALDFSGEARGCNRITGFFEIVELEIVGNAVTKLAADIRHGCEEISTYLFSAVRYNSNVPLERGVVYAVAGHDRAIPEGTPLVLDGSQSYSRTSAIQTYEWSQTSGPPATTADPGSAATSVNLPAVPPGGLQLSFQLRVTDGTGVSRTDEVSILVRSKSEPQSYLLVESELDDFVGEGKSWHFTSDWSVLTAKRNAKNGAEFRFFGDPLREAKLDVAAPFGLPLVPGAYEDAKKYPFGDSASPQVAYVNASQGCDIGAARFDVLAADYATDDTLTTAAVDFEQTCTFRKGMAFGRMRVNISPENEATANAGPDQFATQQSLVTLNASASLGGLSRPIASYAWRQVNGTPVTLNGANTAQPTFTAPALADIAVPEHYLFSVLATDSAGYKDRDLVQVTVVQSTVDTDGDGAFDFQDQFPSNPAESADTDGDGIGNNADDDDDNDGAPDATDAFDTDATEQGDLDGDGIGDNADPDVDNDGIENHPETQVPGQDGNGDGIPDKRQREIVSYYGWTLQLMSPGQVRELEDTGMFAELPEGYSDLAGPHRFKLDVQRGEPVEVRVWMHMEPSARNAYLLHDPNIQAPALLPFPFDGTCGAQAFAKYMLLHLIDGGCGDLDGTENGVIVHYGVGALSDASQGGGGGGGAVPPATLLALLAMAALRRRRFRA